jgi:hypothetical protein
MSRVVRLTLAGGLVAALVALGIAISKPPSSAEGANGADGMGGAGATAIADREAPRFQSSAECAACHREVHDEWHGTQHQISYLNPEVRKLSDDFKNKECAACHLPRPIIETGLLQRTLPRLTRPEEGVDCLTCHLGPGGRIVGKRASNEGCMPIADERMMGVDGCATCHNQHKTTDQWRASKWAAQDVTCNDCHMEKVARKDGREGYSHVFRAAHDLDMLKRAVEVRLDVDASAAKASIEVENVYAGHNFPTEERSRAADLMVRFLAPDGSAGEWTQLFRFRQPYRDEPGENTQLPAHAVHRSEVAIPEGATRLEVRLWYRRNPFAVDGDDESLLVHELARDLQ